MLDFNHARTADQLMASYDSRKTAETYHWYVTDNRPKRVLYGPYPNKEEAEAAHLLTLNCVKINDAIEAKGSWWKRDLDAYQDGPVKYSIGTFGGGDLESLESDPEANGYKSVTINPAAALKRHPSWKIRPYGVDPHDAAMYYVTNDRRYIGG